MYIYDNEMDMDTFRNLSDGKADGAYLSLTQRINYINVVNYAHANVFKTKEYIRTVPFCLYYKKYSCLVEPFNEQITAYTSSGLINFWIKKFRKSREEKTAPNRRKPVSMIQINGIIILCSYLIIFSLIVFVLELLSIKFELIKIFLDFLAFSPRV